MQVEGGKNTMLCALIMAGGKGTRFWPLSTEDRPKQFLNITGEETMIQMTVNRINSFIPMERIFVCTGEKYVNLVKEQLPNLSEKNIIIEPEGRNTAPCIALSAFVIKRYFEDATMVVLPSDHLIKDEEKFINIIKDGSEFLSANNDAILTLGMTPNRPEVGYGYIKYSDDKIELCENEVIKVEAFVEKPDFEKAKEYLKDGSYLWNGGMFMWKVENILEKIKLFLPDTYEALHKLNVIKEENLVQYINENYLKTDSISIDYGILEKTNDIYVIPSDIGWDDVGTWNSMERYREKDENSNITIGDVVQLNSSNSIIISSTKKIIIDDLDDIYVIETEDNIIVGKKKRMDQINKIKQRVGL